MSYPVKITGKLPLNQTLTMPFRPEKAGLVKVIVVATWDSSAPPPPPADAHVFFLAVRLEIVKPGSTAPVATASGRKLVGNDPQKNLGKPQIVLWADTLATAADLGADWKANVVNTGDAPAACTITARFQVVDDNLGKIDHIVVMMMENRSFDHILGYLSLEKNRKDVDGLTGKEFNIDEAKQQHFVQHRTDEFFRNDPEHGFKEVAKQLTSGDGAVTNGGFVLNFAEKLGRDAEDLPPVMTAVRDQGRINGGDVRDISFRPAEAGPVIVESRVDKTITHSESGNLGSIVLLRPDKSVALRSTSPIGRSSLGLRYVATAADLALPGTWTCSVFNGTETNAGFDTVITFVQALHDTSKQESAEAIMGYYNADQLPAYDLLAREFMICDRWFASLPTDTFPNRRYSIAGGSGNDDTTPSSEDVKNAPPAYTEKTIFEVLQEHGADWKIFFADIPFAFVYKRLAQDAQFTERMHAFSNGASSDLEHALETGDLPSVTWIEPNFSDFRESAAAASDDHPPGSIRNGQRLVSQIYTSLSSSPAWTKTLLIITYDEHGGFYDHFPPAGLSDDPDHPAPGGPEDDNPRHKRYGVRVPAFVISPWVQPGSTSHDTYDHTTLLSTILHRFCPDAVSSLGLRTLHALHVGPVLSLNAPRKDIAQMPDIAPPPPPPVAPKREPDSFGDVLRKTAFGF